MAHAFIKIEDLTGRFRPNVKEWRFKRGSFEFPQFNHDMGSLCHIRIFLSHASSLEAGHSPFSGPDPTRQPRIYALVGSRNRKANKKTKSRSLNGYCELCEVNYFKGVEDHCASTEHRTFASDVCSFFFLTNHSLLNCFVFSTLATRSLTKLSRSEGLIFTRLFRASSELSRRSQT